MAKRRIVDPRSWSAALLVVAGVALAGGARADDPPAPTAEQLFDRAHDLAKQGDFRAACPLFAESHRLDPQTGTLLNLAGCEEKTGQLAEALGHYREAIDKLGPGDKLLPYARQQADALDARVPRLTLKLAPGTPAGARVMRDGVEVASAALGVPMAVSPGAHEVVVLAPGREERRSPVMLAEGARLEVTAEAGAEVRPPAPVPVPVPVPEVVPEPAPSFWRTHRVSLGLAGGAAVLVGVGGALGEATWVKYQSLQKSCPGPCTPAQLAPLHQEHTATNVVLGAAGAVGAAALAGFVIEAVGSRRSVAVVGEGAGARVVVRY